jgi:Zn finger protein HypA/HybF involved in hydrogenase expression
MIRVLFHSEDPQIVCVAGISEKKIRKTFECPHCEAEIAYHAYSPLSCPMCKKGMTDVDKLTTDKPYGRIAFHLGRCV